MQDTVRALGLLAASRSKDKLHIAQKFRKGSFEIEKQLSRTCRKSIVIAIGGNVPGKWGHPRQTIEKAMQLLACCGLQRIQRSPIYRTTASGQIRQPPYLNLVVTAKCALSPRQLLGLAKSLERRSGRRLVGRNGPRPLDIDLIDYAGKVVNWPSLRSRPQLVLPHPLMSDRPFVLVPLADLLPHWRHPVSGLTADQLLRRQGGIHRLMLRREISRVDSPAHPCD